MALIVAEGPRCFFLTHQEESSAYDSSVYGLYIFSFVFMGASLRKRSRFVLLTIVLLAIVNRLIGNRERKLGEDPASVVRRAAQGHSYIILTATTYAYRSFTANMACSLQSSGSKAPLVVTALDSESYHWARQMGFASFLAEGETSGGVARFGSVDFNALTARKVLAVRDALASGVDVLFADGDVYWCPGNAAEDVANKARDSPQTDFIAQRANVAHAPVNSGLYYVRPTNQARELLELVAKGVGDRADDQANFNRLLCRHGEVEREKKLPSACTSKNGAVVRFLDPDRYPIGCTRVNSSSIHIIEEPPGRVIDACTASAFGAFHFSCVVAEEKVQKMSERGMWALDHDGRCIEKR